MTPVVIEYPVFTVDQQELLSANTSLTGEIMKELISMPDEMERVYPLFNYGSVKKDLIGFMEQPPYATIFNEPSAKRIVLDNMERVILPLPLLESLYYFHQVDVYTYRHFLLVYALATLLAEQLVSSRKEMIKEVIAGPTHDIGKLCVPLHILNKKSPLTASERSLLQHHTWAGYVLLSYYFKDARHFTALVARDHHERRDGSGYPKGVRIDDLMIDIIMVSDIYDALISHRPYRSESFKNRTALEEITLQALSGKVNPTVVQALIAVNRSNKPHYSKCVLSREQRGTAPADNVYGMTEPDRI